MLALPDLAAGRANDLVQGDPLTMISSPSHSTDDHLVFPLDALDNCLFVGLWSIAAIFRYRSIVSLVVWICRDRPD